MNVSELLNMDHTVAMDWLLDHTDHVIVAKEDYLPLYQFDELSKEAQSKVIDNYRGINGDGRWWENTLDYWKEKLHELGFIDSTIYFSNMYSQGGGACFVSKVDLITLCEHLAMCQRSYTDSNEFISVSRMAYLGMITADVIDLYGSKYSHESTKILDYNHHLEKEPFHIKNVIREIDHIRKKLCQQIFSDLLKEYEYITSDDYIKEYIMENEYLRFTEEGVSF